MKNIQIIKIIGGSCSGKSTLANALTKSIPNSTILSMDYYYKDDQPNYDVPQAIDFQLMKSDISKLFNNQKITVNDYNFYTEKRFAIEILPTKILILEGLFLPEIVDFNCFSVFLDAENELRHNRRIARDTMQRNSNLREIEISWQNAQNGYNEFILPEKENCEVILTQNATNQQLEILLQELKFH